MPECASDPPRHPLAKRQDGDSWLAQLSSRTEKKFNKIMASRSMDLEAILSEAQPAAGQVAA